MDVMFIIPTGDGDVYLRDTDASRQICWKREWLEAMVIMEMDDFPEYFTNEIVPTLTGDDMWLSTVNPEIIYIDFQKRSGLFIPIDDLEDDFGGDELGGDNLSGDDNT